MRRGASVPSGTSGYKNVEEIDREEEQEEMVRNSNNMVRLRNKLSQFEQLSESKKLGKINSKASLSSKGSQRLGLGSRKTPNLKLG